MVEETTTEQLHHRSEPPWEEDLGLEARKAASILGLTRTTWHLPECDLSSERDSPKGIPLLIT